MKKSISNLLERSKTSANSLPVTLLAVFLSGCGLGFLSLYFSAGEHSLLLFGYYLTQPMVISLNVIPFAALCLLFFCLTNRAWLAFAFSSGGCLVYSWAQYWKLMARNDPVYAEDLTIFSEALQMSSSYIEITWQIVLSALIVVAIIVVMATVFRGRFARLTHRIALSAVIIAVSGLLYSTTYTSSGVYQSMKVWPVINEWFETNQYISRGGIYPFIYSIQSAVPTSPEGYDPAQTQALLASYETDDIPEEEKVSVICVMLEAFSDLSAYTDAITGADPYEAFHTLQSESYHGTLVTNIFAGGTIDTERRVVTGFNGLTNFRRPSWSYARYFQEQGYTVNGAHPGNEAFYNRRNVNENLGIADFRFYEGYYEELFPNETASDAQFLSDVAQHCKNQMEDGPVFSFNVTYQNHGPYDTSMAHFSQEYIPQGSLSLEEYHIANNYLAGIHDTSRQMLAMADSFRDSEQPVILVFFGDHKPWLGDQSGTYGSLGIDIFSQTDESFYNYYATEYTIWANDAARETLGKDFTGTGPTISPCYLMNVLFEQCGWEGPGYQKLTDEIMAAMPIVHATGRYQVDGVMVERDSLPEQCSALLTKLRWAQFYLAQDSAGLLP